MCRLPCYSKQQAGSECSAVLRLARLVSRCRVALSKKMQQLIDCSAFQARLRLMMQNLNQDAEKRMRVWGPAKTTDFGGSHTSVISTLTDYAAVVGMTRKG